MSARIIYAPFPFEKRFFRKKFKDGLVLNDAQSFKTWAGRSAGHYARFF